MALEFLPFEEGQIITADDLNALIGAIQNGSIFIVPSALGTQLNTLGSRLNSSEARLDILESFIARQTQREQFTLTIGQSIINLSKTPLLDSEVPALNGLFLAKSGVPVGFSGDYSISGSQITLVPELASLVESGDIFIISYEFEVT
jgi:hypothetical protein